MPFQTIGHWFNYLLLHSLPDNIKTTDVLSLWSAFKILKLWNWTTKTFVVNTVRFQLGNVSKRCRWNDKMDRPWSDCSWTHRRRNGSGGGGRGQTPNKFEIRAPPPPNKPRLTKVWPSPTLNKPRLTKVWPSPNPNIENLPTPMDLAVQKF